jgi:proton-dependent oligopeptide transporter, POT family
MSLSTTHPLADGPAARRTGADPNGDRGLFGHPRGLGLLFCTEMWERFSFYGMRALLILYLVNALGWSTARAANLYGTYTGLVYFTPLLGGWLADRVLGTRRSLVIGGLVIALGHFTLAIPTMPAFYAGLTFIVLGTGLFKPNVSTMVGQLYAEGDPRRDAGFTIFYMGINVGAFLGPIVCGYLAQTAGFGWHWGFAAAGVGTLPGLVA